MEKGEGNHDFCEWRSWCRKIVFSNLVKESTGIETYSASTLIAAKKQSEFSKDKLIPDIDDNQQFLLMAVNELKTFGKNFILDGHFCLLNTSGEVQRISHDTFTMLKPDAIVLLTEKPEIIVSRRRERDKIDITVESVEQFQEEERRYAGEVAKNIGAKLFISNGAEDLMQAIDFIKSL